MDPIRGSVGVPLYRADQARDGTYTIYDVPIFSAHAEELRDGTSREFTPEWLSGAVQKGLQRNAEGYLPPLHVRHHGDGEVEAAGKFRVTRVGSILHGGVETPTVFADLVGVRPAIYERIRKGELSYRSVEILDVGATEIDSLALLDDEVPFFRFPLLRVAESDPTRVVTLSHGGPVLAYSQAGHSRSALSHYSTESNMTEPKTGRPSGEPTKFAANAEQLLQQIFQLLNQAMGTGAEGGPTEQPQPQMAQQPQPQQPQQPMPQQAQRSPFAAFSASEASTDAVVKAEAEGTQSALLARMAVMEKELNDMREARKVDAKATELVGAGFGADQVQAFRAKASEAGLAVASAYAAGMERIGPSEPPTHWTGEIRHQAPDAEEVLAFAAKGPEALSRARDLHGSWTRSGSELSFADFFAANADADAFLGL